MIESDPEDDEDPGPAAGGGALGCKKARGPALGPPDQMTDMATLPPSTHHPSASAVAAFNMDTDISQLEAPTFTTLDRGPSQKMMELSWDHKVNLIGKKVGENKWVGLE